MHEKYLFGIAIYRRTETAFWVQYERDLDEYMDGAMAHPAMSSCSPEMKRDIELRYCREYPCPRRYNDVIGYVHVYAFWDQIRGDLWKVQGDRYTRHMKKVFRDNGQVFEMHVGGDRSDEELSREVRGHLIEAGQRFNLKGVVTDTAVFDNITPYLDWRALLHSLRP